jgi:outer membrane receptor protein involved in Fe transport
MNQMATIRAFILSGLIILTSTVSLFAQQKKKSYSEEVTVTSPFEPSVADGNKITFQPKISDSTIRLAKQVYTIKPFPLQTKVTMNTLDAAKLSEEQPQPIFRNYIKGGFGTTVSPYVEFFASNGSSENQLLSVHVKHLSSMGDISNQWFTGHSENLAQVTADFFNENNTIKLNGSYNRDVFHYYAPKLFKGTKLHEPTEDSLRQRYGLIKASFAIIGKSEDEDALKYNFSIDASHLEDYYKTQETNFLIKGMLRKTTDWFSFSDHQSLGLNVSVDQNSLKNILRTKSSALVELLPAYHLLFDEYQIKAGLKVTFDLDSVSQIHLNPILETKISLISDKLSLLAGITGGLIRNNFNTLRLTNPFISSLSSSVTSNERFTIYAGLKGNIAQTVDFEARFESKIIDNMPLFINDTLSTTHQQRFDVITDDINLISVLLSAGYTGTDFQFKLKGTWNKYSTNAELYAWHCPDLEGALEAGYIITPKWSVNTKIYTWSGSYAKTWDSSKNIVAKKINGASDINIGLTYKSTKQFSVFLNLNNLLNSSYEKWNLYPSYGFNAMAGLSYAF